MNVLRNILCAGMVLLLFSGCVSRTVRRAPTLSETANSKGDRESGKVIEKKIVWFWQDDF